MAHAGPWLARLCKLVCTYDTAFACRPQPCRWTPQRLGFSSRPRDRVCPSTSKLHRDCYGSKQTRGAAVGSCLETADLLMRTAAARHWSCLQGPHWDRPYSGTGGGSISTVEGPRARCPVTRSGAASPRWSAQCELRQGSSLGSQPDAMCCSVKGEAASCPLLRPASELEEQLLACCRPAQAEPA